MMKRHYWDSNISQDFENKLKRVFALFSFASFNLEISVRRI